MVDGDRSRKTVEMYGGIIKKPTNRSAKKKHGEDDDIGNLGYIPGRRT
jgi:hypothetical protein